jgi:hypothetical protein
LADEPQDADRRSDGRVALFVGLLILLMMEAGAVGGSEAPGAEARPFTCSETTRCETAC